MNHLPMSHMRGSLGQQAFAWGVLLIVIALTALTALAIIGLQVQVYAGQPWLAAFYATLFCIVLAFEVLGFTLLAQRFGAGAWGKGCVILLIWLIAVPFVSYQEWRFHKLHDVSVEQAATGVDAATAYRTNRLREIEARLTVLGDQRSTAQIDQELARFIGIAPDRRSVRAQRQFAALTAERTLAAEVEALAAEKDQVNQQLAANASASVDTRSVFKLGQDFTVPGLNLTVSEDQMLVGLIVLMAAIRSFGLWALLGADHPAPTAKTQGQSQRPWRWPWQPAAAAPVAEDAPPAPLPGHMVRRGRHGWVQVKAPQT